MDLSMKSDDIKKCSVKVTEPIEFEVGQSFQIAPVEFHSSDANQIPQSVKNWDVFQGAMLAVVVASEECQEVVGTACMIAVGLAVTAAHVFAGLVEQIVSGALGIACFGITTETGEHWRVTELSYAAGEEIAYLSLARASELGQDRVIRIFKLTTRAPKVGELVTMVGFRFPEIVGTRSPGLSMIGHMFAAKGPVTNVYHPRRDNSVMTFPVIEVDCGSLGGMSGGALLDNRGFLLGVTSRGWETADGLGPSYAAWLLGGLNRRVTIGWPAGLYPAKQHVLDIDPRLLLLEGRERVEIIDDNNYSYRVWFDPD
jgi:hypothetical protein